MKYKVVQKFEVSLEKLLQAREDRYKHLDKFPDLKNVTLLEEARDGIKLIQKRKIDLGASLPSVLSSVLSEPCLIEDSVFYADRNVHEFKLYPPGKENVVVITGVSHYREVGENESERVYDVEVRSRLPLLAPAVEVAIEGIHRHSLEKDKNSIRKFLDLG